MSTSVMSIHRIACERAALQYGQCYYTLDDFPGIVAQFLQSDSSCTEHPGDVIGLTDDEFDWMTFYVYEYVHHLPLERTCTHPPVQGPFPPDGYSWDLAPWI